MNFSIIIPVYNRPDEVNELLDSLTWQTYDQFEVIIVEDGSDVPSREVVQKYESQLEISYYLKENEGPARARNFGARKARYDFFVFFDSDCIIPDHYFEIVNHRLGKTDLDVYGGPDRAADTFTNIQKAISYSMTSLLTTGGIRGSNQGTGTFYPRSFNMGMTRDAFEAVEGFADMRFGEDVDLSLRLEKDGFALALIGDAFVYHKRRTSFRSFFKQVYNSGLARIHLASRHPGSMKAVHVLPSLFVIYCATAIGGAPLAPWLLLPVGALAAGLFVESFYRERSPAVALLSIWSSFVQLGGYGLGFLSALFKKYLLRSEKYTAFDDTFYE